MNATSPIYMVCESLTSKKSLPIDQLPVIFRNMAEYLQCVPAEAGVGLAVWSQAMQALESLLRQVIVIMPSMANAEYMLDLIAATLRLNCVPKTLLDPYAKITAYCVQHTNLEYQTIYDLCTLNTRSFNKDRDKNLLCRQMIFEFVQALKFKSNIPDHNLLMIIGFVLLDAGGTLPPGALPGLPDAAPVLTTNAADCLRQYINDVIDFLADFHTLSKIKVSQRLVIKIFWRSVTYIIPELQERTTKQWSRRGYLGWCAQGGCGTVSCTGDVTRQLARQ